MRQIYICDAKQVVVSDAHPEGVYSVIGGWPKTFDSRSYGATEQNPNGNEEKALAMAKSAFHSQLSALEASDTRAAWCITLERADGTQIMREKWGAFPDMTPPEPEPETEDEIPLEDN